MRILFVVSSIFLALQSNAATVNATQDAQVHLTRALSNLVEIYSPSSTERQFAALPYAKRACANLGSAYADLNTAQIDLISDNRASARDAFDFLTDLSTIKNNYCSSSSDDIDKMVNEVTGLKNSLSNLQAQVDAEAAGSKK